jgi:hypothetical protein
MKNEDIKQVLDFDALHDAEKLFHQLMIVIKLKSKLNDY